ncbi:MAG: family 65 glycosyl hydrolase [Bacilli bacterium]|jgi:maltose phosphorylase|nr:family 65 glycosyl hydrolase [Bacilli bacterium]MCH4211060.1 family 65 glycosyl hydrolase [Bacilli bacterium]MCH4228788.1 family 65 glycosyl hydrolase [Bacilli bacterium]MCH4278240.1 family 65 glycosyl hydrolase [Bacilli bacterium]
MAKKSDSYLSVEKNAIVENGFHKEKNQVSESLFSLGNEYSGVRGFFEEGVSLPSLIGTYYNGIIEYGLKDTPNAYLGIAKRTHFTINSTNYLKAIIIIDGVRLDLGKEEVEGFKRSLSFDNGLYERSFSLHRGQKKIEVSFKRMLGMNSPHEAVQEISFLSSEDADLDITMSLDGTILHWGDHNYWEKGDHYESDCEYGLYLKTPTTKQSLLSLMKIEAPCLPIKTDSLDKEIDVHYHLTLKKGIKTTFTRYVINIADKKGTLDYPSTKKSASEELDRLVHKGLFGLTKENEEFFALRKTASDIEIDGDEKDQQGIRFCLFNLLQAYTGLDGDDNIGAKGLTGEAYSGHAFWDSETYCLPYYLFSNEQAAKDLLLFRYHTLEQAKKRAKELDCEGACFPIATRNGEEACTLWQHASTQLQPTSAVGYAIFHYMNLYDDESFLREYGLEMLLEISKFLLTRGQWNQTHTRFGYYGVMGPDEFEVMVNHNTYTNYMGKRIMSYTLSILQDPKYENKTLLKRCGYDQKLINEMKEAIEKMCILYDPKTKLYEQHQGFYDLPHIDVDKIPVSDFPLYSHWAYDRIFRNDMIKQPDVLMFLFLYASDFSKEVKKANYEYYEPRCIHESSLSPSVHSIIAEEIGKDDEALSFFGFATRLDLDDYNRNTSEGLHMTSIAAAWMNIVYGFLGLRSDRTPLAINPKLPKRWSHYSVRLMYHHRHLKFDVYPNKLTITNEDAPVSLIVYGQSVMVDKLYEVNR